MTQYRGQPGNSGQYRSAPKPQSVSADEKHEVMASPELVITGEGPYRCYIQSRDRFYDLLKILKGVPGRRYDGLDKAWVIPEKRVSELCEAIRQAQHQKFLVQGGPSQDESRSATVGPASAEEKDRETEAYASGKKIAIPLRYEQVDTREAVKEMGARWDSDNQVWLLPQPDSYAAWSSLSKRLAAQDIKLEIPDGVSQAHEAVSVRSQQQLTLLDDLPLELRPYQREGVKFLLENRRVLLADETGLGKTVQSLAAVAADEAFPALVVCPASTRTNWTREAQRMFPDREVVGLEKSLQKGELVQGDVIVVSYDSLSRRQKHLPLGVKAVICDEMHYMQSPKAARTKAVSSVMEDMVSDDPLLVGLSATPVRNRTRELLPFLEASDTLKRIGTKNFFYKRYCGPDSVWTGHRMVMTFDGATNTKELHDRLSDSIMLRRRKVDVLKELPDKITKVAPMDLLPALQKVYDAMATELASQIVDDSSSALMEWSKYGRSDPLDSGDENMFDQMMLEGFTKDTEDKLLEYQKERTSKPGGMIKLTELRKLLAVVKRPAASARVQQFLDEADPSEKMVVFGHHRSMVQGIADEFGAGIVIGGQNDKERSKIIDDFTNKSEPRVLVCSIGAAGVGLNLQRANNVLFVEQPWTPAECEQAEGRCYRMGQDKGVMVEYLVAANTIDERIADTIATKRAITGNVLDGAGNWDNELIGHIHEALQGFTRDREARRAAKRNVQRSFTDEPVDAILNKF